MKINLTLLIFALQFLFFDLKAQFTSQNSPRSSLNLDGQVNFIDAGNNDRNITNAFTLETWVKTKAIHRQWIIGKQATTAGYRLIIDNGNVELSGTGATGVQVTSGPSLIKVNDNKWHHVAGVFFGSRLEIWVDGILQSTSPIGSPVLSLPTNVALIIGRNPQNTNEYFKGLLGEIKLWNTARTASEIRTFMSKIVKVNPPELVGYFRCDPTLAVPLINTVLHDFSNLHLHGQINANKLDYVLPAPPIGDESIFYYGNDLAAKTFKMGGYKTDTVRIQNIQGQAKGFHFYRNNIFYNLTGYPPPNHSYVTFYYGAFAAGDTNTTYKAKLSLDTANCSTTFVFMKRKDSSAGFEKLRPGRYNAALDTSMQFSEKKSGEYAYVMVRPEQKVFFNGNVTECPESRPNTLTISKGQVGQWSTGVFSKSISVTQPGKYWVILYDKCSEIGTDTFRIVPGLPVILPKLKTSDTIICHNKPLILRMPKTFNYQWPDGSTADTFAITTAGTYEVKTIDPRCGNFVSSSVKVRTITCNDENVFIPNIITPNHNGLNDALAPIGMENGQWGLSIFNRWGKQVYQTINYKNDWKADGLGSGVYYYFFQSAKTAKTYKGFVEVVK